MKQRKAHYFVDHQKPKGISPPEYYRYINGVWETYDAGVGWSKAKGNMADSYEGFISADANTARLVRISEADFMLSQI